MIATEGVTAKITTAHLQRRAVVYVRQSSMQQVEHNRESQANQYRLVERAQALGWSPTQVRVIDSDLGKSGTESTHRIGFTELLAQVSLGEVGIILGYEVSRLARNNSDWYHLLDLAAVFGTLIADSDGVYDPRLYNDRLLLGLKGTLSEAEIHLLRLRMTAGRLSKVQRGDYRQCLPTGWTRAEDGTVLKDPDEQVQRVLELVFAKFAELGSCHGVFRYLRREQILLPKRPSNFRLGPLTWQQASPTAVRSILTNPAYAGAFVYGRKRVDPARRTAAHSSVPRAARPREEWLQIHYDAYPAYITWDQYLANQERLHQNNTRYLERRPAAAGVAREGSGLLQGLAMCGQCGRRMYTNYKPRPCYACAQLSGTTDHLCAVIPGPAVEAVVTQAFFDALQPAELDALEQVLAMQQAEHARLARHWQDQVQRARYEAQRAEQQYEAVDPANRLVANTLEQRWEDKLEQLHAVEAAQQKFLQSPRPAPLPAEFRDQCRHLSQALPCWWRAGELTCAQQKEFLRVLVASVILKRLDPGRVEVRIVGVSGHYSRREVQVPIQREADLTNYAALTERVRELFEQRLTDAQIAATLTQEGFRSARRNAISPSKVFKIRLANRWLKPYTADRQAAQVNGQWTTKSLAARLEVGVPAILRLIYKRTIPQEHVHRAADSGVYLIDDYPGLFESLQPKLKT